MVEGDEGLASSSSTSSLTFVALPSLVDRVRVADLPAFLKELKMSIKLANSSPIFSTESEEMKTFVRSSQNTSFLCGCKLARPVFDQLLNFLMTKKPVVQIGVGSTKTNFQSYRPIKDTSPQFLCLGLS